MSAVEGLRIYGTTPDKCSILSFNAEGVHAYDMGMILDKLGIAVRTGAHCADPVMEHYGVKGMVRASFAFYNTEREADALVAGVERACVCCVSGGPVLLRGGSRRMRQQPR